MATYKMIIEESFIPTLVELAQPRRTTDMNTTTPPLFDKVASVIGEAHLVAFDGCHKIYVALDPMEADWFRENYEIIVDGTPDEMLAAVIRWYDESCFLKFVSGVRYNPDDPNAGFIPLIRQGEEEDWD